MDGSEASAISEKALVAPRKSMPLLGTVTHHIMYPDPKENGPTPETRNDYT